MARTFNSPLSLFGVGGSVLALSAVVSHAVPATTQPATTIALPAVSTTQPSTQVLLPDIRLPAIPASRPATRKISLNFKDAPLDAVLDHLSEAAGLVVIREGQVEGRVTVQSTEPVSPEEAVTLLNAVLKANGFTAVQNGRTVRISPREKAKKGNVPVHVGANPADIAATDELITQVIPLINVDAARLRQDLAPLIGTDADVTANDASNSIIITDSSANIRRIVEIISVLDQGQSSGTEMRIMHLKFANAETTAKLIASVFRPTEGAGGGMTPQQMQQLQQQGGNQAPPPRSGSREGRIPGGAIDQALRGGHVRADADERTNTLILTAPPATLKVVEDIVKELDSNPMPASQLKAFRLNFADADATSKLLTNLLKGGDSQSGFPFFNPFGGNSEPGAHAKINITSDERTNSVIVSAPAEVLTSVAALIKDLDSSPGTGSEIRTFQLKYADAWATSKMITSIFDPENKDQNSNPFRFIFFGGSSPPSSKGPKITATSDDRTNTLVVTGPKEAMKVVEDLVTKLDSNTTAEESLLSIVCAMPRPRILSKFLTLYSATPIPRMEQTTDKTAKMVSRTRSSRSRSREAGLAEIHLPTPREALPEAPESAPGTASATGKVSGSAGCRDLDPISHKPSMR